MSKVLISTIENSSYNFGYARKHTIQFFGAKMRPNYITCCKLLGVKPESIEDILNNGFVPENRNSNLATKFNQSMLISDDFIYTLTYNDNNKDIIDTFLKHNGFKLFRVFLNNGKLFSSYTY